MLNLISKKDSESLAEIARNTRIIAEGVARLLKLDIKTLDNLATPKEEIEVVDLSLEQIAVMDNEDRLEELAQKMHSRKETQPFWREDKLDLDDLSELS